MGAEILYPKPTKYNRNQTGQIRVKYGERQYSEFKLIEYRVQTESETLIIIDCD